MYPHVDRHNSCVRSRYYYVQFTRLQEGEELVQVYKGKMLSSLFSETQYLPYLKPLKYFQVNG